MVLVQICNNGGYHYHGTPPNKRQFRDENKELPWLSVNLITYIIEFIMEIECDMSVEGVTNVNFPKLQRIGV